jgi:5-methylcytosine-specific restriction endonuclease McrA
MVNVTQIGVSVVDIQQNKMCTKCGVIRPLSMFHNDRGSKDGKCCYCKFCRTNKAARMLQDDYVEGKRYCVECKRWLDIDCFYVRYDNTGLYKSKCKECFKIDCRVLCIKIQPWKTADPVKMRLARRKSYEKNIIQNMKRNYLWCKQHPERRKEIVRNSHRRHPESMLLAGTKRRMVMKDVLTERFTRKEIYDRDGGVCYYCGNYCEEDNWHLDHIIAVSCGGSHTRSNVTVSCAGCNLRKQNKKGWHLMFAVNNTETS